MSKDALALQPLVTSPAVDAIVAERIDVPHYGASYGFDLSLQGSVNVIPSVASSPWWISRVVRLPAEVSVENAMLWRRSEVADFSLDLGRNVVSAVEAIGPDFSSLLQMLALSHIPGLDELALDHPDAVALAPVVRDDADWDEPQHDPEWLTLRDVSYRGGGLMSRRRRGPTE